MNDFRSIILPSGVGVRFTPIEIDFLEKAYAKAKQPSKSSVSWTLVLNYFASFCKHEKFERPSSLVYSRTSDQLASKWKEMKRT